MSRADEMREVFARWRKSGLTLRSFGIQEGIGYSTLRYWQQKLGDPHRTEKRDRGKVCRQEPGNWMPVRVVAPSSPTTGSGREWFEIRVTNGHMLRVPPGFDEAELRRVLAVLATC